MLQSPLYKPEKEEGTIVDAHVFGSEFDGSGNWENMASTQTEDNTLPDEEYGLANCICSILNISNNTVMIPDWETRAKV